MTNTADSGAGSLRQAIISADAQSGGGTITFNIGTGAKTISPSSALPSLTGKVTIDATTQPGFAGTPLITLNGSSAGSGVEGLTLSGNNDTVLGLAIDNFNDCGILITGSSNTVAGNYIGVTAAGTAAAGNGGSGVKINSGTGNVIGGTTAATRNVIAANGNNDAFQDRGVLLNGVSGNTVEGNYFGTNAAGTVALANYGDDICLVGAANNTIGGTVAGAGNLISGSGRVGIWVDGSGGDLIAGNLIGTDVTGTKSIGNVITGIMLEGAANVTIGGTTALARNVISANTQDGILIHGSGATNNLVEGNYIGTTAAGNAALGNVGNGIEIVSGGNNTIGGITPGAGNVISGNTTSGITIDGSSGDLIEGNLIGTDSTGTIRVPNHQNGINIIDGASNDTIGGKSAGASNLISGNCWDGILVCGIAHSGTGNLSILGNEIGTNLAGTKAIPNCADGVQVNWGASNVVIGGSDAASANLISGNARDGVHIFKSTGNTVAGNKIGTDVTGKLALGNTLNGVYLGSGGNMIGGTTGASGNIISGNGTNGIWVNGSCKTTISGVVFDTNCNTDGVSILGNSIGVNSTGAALPNGNDGLYLVMPGKIQIGGSTGASANTIVGKSANGSYATGGSITYLTGGSGTTIHNNGGWSIEEIDAVSVTMGNNTIETVTAVVDPTAKTITIGSKSGNTLFKFA